ncbi:unnamed protein product [Paramecium octaurelia]|uniref:Uncharacterized protein n=1 Tax=Paramecium octaurelia TaxID=43137 RepID=A0A8S1SAU6_PAROT|nr:unnamed protein product [Paramecium octaurelia]
MDQNLKKLQDLLINEIINKQYNEEDFQSYAYEKYPDKDELYKWDFDDLNLLVKQYQQLQNQKAGNKDQIISQEQSHKINQQNQVQNFQDENCETRVLKQSRLIPKRSTAKSVFPNSITKEQAQQNAYTKDDLQILEMIYKERCQIQFDNQIVFSEYEKDHVCQKKIQYIEENVKLSFKVTTINTKNLIFSNQVFCIETQPFNWKVERSKEDLWTLEKIMLMYFPEYSGYKLQYDQKQNFQLHLENALNTYYNKPKTRCLDYFLLFLNDNKANELRLKNFSHYTQNEKNIRNAQLNHLSSPSGQLKIEFSNQNYQAYKRLQNYQNQFYKNYKIFEKQIQESQQIIYQEIEKMKYQLILLRESNKKIFIQDEFAQKIPQFNFEIFYDQIYVALNISNESKKFISNTLEQISKKISQNTNVLEQPLIKCSKNEHELRNIYINKFLTNKQQFLDDKEIQSKLNFYGLNVKSFSDYQYETISSIIPDIFPLKFDLNYEVLQKCKDEFAYHLQQVLLEAQIVLSESFADINLTCKNNFNEFTQAINNSINSDKNT